MTEHEGSVPSFSYALVVPPQTNSLKKGER